MGWIFFFFFFFFFPTSIENRAERQAQFGVDFEQTFAAVEEGKRFGNSSLMILFLFYFF